jgi:putative ABC transport system permease protein
MMGMPVRKGRAFADGDDAHSARVAIVSSSVASRFWPNGDALGQRIAMTDTPAASDWMTIVGVVDDVRQQGVRDKPMPAIYLPLAQVTGVFTLNHLTFAAHARGSVNAVASAMRAAVRSVDPEQPVESVESMNSIIAASVAEPRFQTTLLALFSALALLLAAVGIYGVLAYSVNERTREIGVRVALGAAPETVIAMVVRRTLALVVPGLVIGIACALGLTRTLSRFLFEIKPTDPATLVAVPVLLTVVALVAAWAPARRASKIDPMLTLRAE